MDERATAMSEPATVLIADDNPEARRLLEVHVMREGYRAIVVENGKQALEILASHNVDAVLLDIDMPEKDGYDVLAAVKTDPRCAHVPVLMISGGGALDDQVRCIEMGAVDYLTKPFNQAVLRARLAACIANNRQHDRELQGKHQSFSAFPTIQSPESESRTVLTPPPRPATAMPSMQETRPQNTLTQSLGRIVLERMIGSGSMVNVFLGHHELLDLPVAVKVLRPDRLTDPEMRARILREARVTARVGHRNIVRLLEAGETENGIYLAYEYVDGGTLEELLARSPDRMLSIFEAARIAREIATGLAEINWIGITHRNINPGNILLTQTGEVKLADLGLAKDFAALSPITFNGEHGVVGTPAYMAPEQVEGRHDLDIRCDLYALGAVLYEMLTGQPPFTAATPMAVLACHRFQPVQPPTQLRRGIPECLETMCLKLLAKNLADRPLMPEALLAEMQATGF